MLFDDPPAGPGGAADVRPARSATACGRKTRRSHLGDVLSLLANLKPAGETDIAHSLVQVAAMLRHASLVMVFSDLLAEPEPILAALYRLRHGGHDVILFHILDEAEVHFPFDGMVEFEEPETRPAAGPGRRRLPPGVSRRGRSLPRPLSPRVFSGRHRLRAAGHQHAVRSGAGRVSDAEKRRR